MYARLEYECEKLAERPTKYVPVVLRVWMSQLLSRISHSQRLRPDSRHSRTALLTVERNIILPPRLERAPGTDSGWTGAS